jgi:hypothetical protein
VTYRRSAHPARTGRRGEFGTPANQLRRGLLLWFPGARDTSAIPPKPTSAYAAALVKKGQKSTSARKLKFHYSSVEPASNGRRSHAGGRGRLTDTKHDFACQLIVLRPALAGCIKIFLALARIGRAAPQATADKNGPIGFVGHGIRDAEGRRGFD